MSGPSLRVFCSLAIFFAEEIAHLGASKNRSIFPGAVKIATATAENRAILVHSQSSILFTLASCSLGSVPPTSLCLVPLSPLCNRFFIGISGLGLPVVGYATVFELHCSRFSSNYGSMILLFRPTGRTQRFFVMRWRLRGGHLAYGLSGRTIDIDLFNSAS